MKIQKLSMEALKIPFKQTFGHASAVRNTTEAVLVKVQNEDGLMGYGEGCPRSYVTGETIQTSLKFFEDYKGEISVLRDVKEIKQWIQEREEAIDKNPAAWCAIELALLDLLGKENGQTIETLLSLPKLAGAFYYTAVLGSDGLKSFKGQLQQYVRTGFKDYKIKVSGKVLEDRKKIDALRRLEGHIRVRLDANNLWDNADQVITYIETLNYPFFAIEEPLKVGDYDGCQRIATALHIPIIMDESFLRPEHFKEIANAPNNWIINLRVSKMGGVLRSLAIAEKAKEYDIPLIVGAQVGETSILTRAALAVANAYRDNLLAQEGAFGTYLLEKDIVVEPIMFGEAGRLNASSIPALCEYNGL